METALETGSIISLTPIEASSVGWRINPSLLDYVISEVFSLRLLVVVRYSSGYWVHGSHRCISKPYPHHRITLSQIRDANYSNETLHHELAHCRQAELWAKEYNRPLNKFYREAYKIARGPWGSSYRENAFEKDARKWAASMNVQFQLIESEAQNG